MVIALIVDKKYYALFDKFKLGNDMHQGACDLTAKFLMQVLMTFFKLK